MRGHLESLGEPQRSQANGDLDKMLLRGTEGYAAERAPGPMPPKNNNWNWLPIQL